MKEIKFWLIILLACPALSIAQDQTVKDFFGINTFAGRAFFADKKSQWPPLEMTDWLKVHRCFVTNQNVCHDEGIFSFGPTHQNWDYDVYFKEAKKRGVKIIYTTQGGFSWMETAGKIDKRMPIPDAADPYNSESYKPLADLVYYVAYRYGSKKYTGIPDRGQPILYPEYRRNKVRSGLNVVEVIEIQNEYDFVKGWGKMKREFDAKSYAICFATCYDAIKQADPNMKVMVGGSISPDPKSIKAFLIEYKKHTGNELPNDVILNFHYYCNDKSLGQGYNRTTGISPEDGKLKYYMNGWDTLGYAVAVTEYGYDDLASSIQSAPKLPGYSLSESMAILNVRTAAIHSTGKNYKYSTMWHIRDGDGVWGYLYANGGLYGTRPDYKPKREAIAIIQEYLKKVGSYLIPAELINNGPVYKVKYYKPGAELTMTWTNDSKPTYRELITDSVEVVPLASASQIVKGNKQIAINAPHEFSISEIAKLYHIDKALNGKHYRSLRRKINKIKSNL